MTGATMFSGILCPEVAMPWVDWKFCAEIDPFACSLIRERRPLLPNLGDVTADDFEERALQYGPIDLLVAGSPCQSFSIAGKRESLGNARGNLTLRFLEVVRAINPRFVLWENVPGIFSAKDNPFGCFLAGLVGADTALVPPAQCGGRWTNAGLVAGPLRVAAWRILDAQHFGVPQRRKRVFVLAGRAGEWPHPAAVLLKTEGVSRHSSKGEETGESLTYATAPSLTASGRGVERAGESRGQDPVVACERRSGLVAHTLNAKAGTRCDGESETFVTHSLRAEGFDASEDGTGRGVSLVAFSCKDSGSDHGAVSPTLRSMGHDGSHANAGGQVAIAQPIPFDTSQMTSKANRSNPQSGDPCHPLTATGDAPAIAQSNTSWLPQGYRVQDADGIAETFTSNPAGGMKASPILSFESAVRRLLPTETEKLQGLPPGWTAVTYRSKPAADGPRYRAVGNGMAVPVLAYIGERLRRSIETSKERAA